MALFYKPHDEIVRQRGKSGVTFPASLSRVRTHAVTGASKSVDLIKLQSKKSMSDTLWRVPPDFSSIIN